MKFCDKCGALLMPGKGKTLSCPSCGKRVKAEKLIIKESGDKKHPKLKKVPKEIKATEPVVDATCDKCKNKKAYWWTAQVGAAGPGADEVPEVEFYRCTKCSNTWRKSG
ncbi:MAG: transcription factor S [DPANN group archaeon]|nr:transcription factor S [DPANN group archaeon]